MISTAEKILSAWEHKKQRDGTYRGNCPYRSGSDSNGFVLTIDDGEHGAYTDHAGSESGSLYDLAEKLGIETPKDGRVDVANTKKPYEGLEDYAKRHFTDVKNFINAGWKEETLYGRSALTYPVQSGKRGRYIDEKSDKSPYTWIGDNAGNCWYGLNRAINIALQTASPLIICNGEASTITAQSYNIPAFCGVGGEGAVSDSMKAELVERWQGQLLIALDCDTSGRDAADKLSDIFPDAIKVDLGLGDKGDLADFCGLHGESALSAIKRMAIKDSKPELADDVSEFVEFVDSHSLLSTFSKFVFEEPELFGRVIKMPFASMRKAGGFAEIMTTKKVWLIGNVSGGGKTLMSESLCDEWNCMGYNTFYIGDEWTPMEMLARQLMRSSPIDNPVSYMDFLRYVRGDYEFTADDHQNIAFAMRNVRSREGHTYFMKVSDNHQGVVFLEDIMESAKNKINTLRASGVRVDVIILDYLSLYDTKAKVSGNNIEEYKAGVLKAYCKSLDVLGVSTVQVKKEAETRVKERGGFLTQHDLFWVRADKGNLITTMNRVFKTNLEVNPDMNIDTDGNSIYNPYIDENGNPEPTPNFCMVTAKNSVSSPFEYAYFHFDFNRMQICEGISPDYYYDTSHNCLLPKDHPLSIFGTNVVDLSNL